MRRFTAYLEKRPEDVGVRWLLNVAAMTLGEYPDKVPAKYLIPLEPFQSRIDLGRFPNVAARIGLDPGGNMAGGSILDDFNGDGLIDVFTSTANPTRGARLFVNRGDGTFEDRSQKAGLAGQIAALNCNQADYDNDGDLDVYLMRGGWENAIRPSLLRNEGDGTFTDVTAGQWRRHAHRLAVGRLGRLRQRRRPRPLRRRRVSAASARLRAAPAPHCPSPIRAIAAGSTATTATAPSPTSPSRRAFSTSAGPRVRPGATTTTTAGSTSTSRTRARRTGSTTTTATAPSPTSPRSWASPSRSIAFRAGSSTTTTTAGKTSSSTASRRPSPTPSAAISANRPQGERPRLYHNEGSAGFRDVTKEAGLDRILLVMGSNFGDIDNDGYLDIYLGTGQPAYFYVVPNVMLKNVEGKRFEDVTTSTGTGHLQKGHGISFAD